MRRKRKFKLSDQTFPVSAEPCPYCGAVQDRLGFGEDDEPPDPRTAITICIRCGGVCVLTPRLKRRKITEQEYADFLVSAEQEILEAFHTRRFAINLLNNLRKRDGKDD